jgi:hypothetical protein
MCYIIWSLTQYTSLRVHFLGIKKPAAILILNILSSMLYIHTTFILFPHYGITAKIKWTNLLSTLILYTTN